MERKLEKLTTEQRNKNTFDIDKIETRDILKKINDEDRKIAEIINLEIDNIAKVIDKCVERIKLGGRIIYCGAGTSGRLGVLDAVECRPTYGVSEELVQGLLAGGRQAMFKAKEGAEDSLELCENDLKKINFSENDILIGLAASGRTPYVIGGLKYAKEVGGFTASIACNRDSEITKYSEVGIEIVTGPEVITGSTRMKAGTATKLVLNMISTTVMIKIGKVYSNLMVDVRATNLKLVERAKRIVRESSNATLEESIGALNKTNYNVKEAIMYLKTQRSLSEIKEALYYSEGVIVKALEYLQ